MTGIIFIVAALTSSPQPAPNYFAEISPQITAEIQDCIISEEYRQHIDFNGDGKLTIADAVGVEKRYNDNCTYGSEITLDAETVYSIAEENYPDELVYWELDRINGELTRQYETAFNDVTEAEIYLEFENYSDTVTVEVNPFTEIISIKEV